MAIFDIEKDELLRLSDTQLEELIARLAEAEVAAHRHSPAWVSWSGSINAPDCGIDIHVQVPADTLNTGFLARPDTILQAKKHSMSKGAIKNEMVTGGQLSEVISEQASRRGSYIIVSLDDDCSPPMKRARIAAMRDAVKDDPHSDSIHLNFFDRSKLTQWLRQYPSVTLWVKGKLGQGYSGWQPFGAWSNPPKGADDTLISAAGVTVTLPSEKGRKLNIEDAIDPMRELIRSTPKAVRITGLSGVGKTRIVQALFDETVGKEALDRTIAVYVDTGAEPNPSAAAMLDRLISESRRAIVILDNCPSELHSSLAGKVSAAGDDVQLITVEYDIKDDKPQTTEVIHIEAVGPEVAEQLVIRRFPYIGRNNARRVAEFADGNARVSLAIAERVQEGESLAQLSDAQLFERLFEQRNQPDDNLREQAEALSLVYSFSVSKIGERDSELEVLGSILGHSSSQLFRSVKKLLDRHVMQKRGHWRAILPQVIANRLAASALDSIPVDQLRVIFEAPGRGRLLMSFAHRLGLLHDHPVAKEIVEAWLYPGGLLGQILTLEDTAARMLSYVGPVVPETLLDRIEAELTSPDFDGMEPRFNPQRAVILNLLQLLAYDASAFDRCVNLLIHLADYEGEENNYDSIRDKITRFFQAYLSGTHASRDQRIAVMNQCLSSDVSGRRSLGFRMLSTALGGPPWTGFGVNEFGARPRNFGFQPNHNELVQWRNAFIDIALQLGTSGDSDLENPARLVLANKFRAIWHQKAIRRDLVVAARKMHAHRPWGEGWKAVRSTIYLDHKKHKDGDEFEPLPDELAELEKELEPSDLVSKITTYVLSKGHDYWMLDPDLDHDDPQGYHESEKRFETMALRLGEDFAASGYELGELGDNLFCNGFAPYVATFGRGLVRGSHDLEFVWQELLKALSAHCEGHKNFAIFGGFIEEVNSIDSTFAQDLLDQCARHPELRLVLVALHPRLNFKEQDLDRCMAILDDPDIRPWMYGPILWRDEYAGLPEERLLELAQRLLRKSNGDDVVLDAVNMKLHGQEGAIDTLGAGLRSIGLRAAIQRLARDHHDPDGAINYKMGRVVAAALRCDGNETEKLEWINTIFDVMDERYGYIHGFDIAIETTVALMPEVFLNRVFQGTEEEQSRRQFFIRHGGLHRSVFAKVDVGVLIEWCRSRDEVGVWASVAPGIKLWSKDGDKVLLSESALRLLEACPEPEEVLEVFAERATPSSWSGSQADVMQPRVDAIRGLADHDNEKIAAAARLVTEKLTRCIESIRVREQREDEEREQRFE